MLEHVPCNHCGHEVTHGVRNVSRLVRCLNCGLIFVNPRPPFEELARQYEGSYFNCPEPTFGGYEDYEADREDIVRTFRRRMKLIRPVTGPAAPRLLDVGCATGTLVGAGLPEGRYDIITMWDLLEHVPDPAGVLAECHRLLRPGGMVALSTPDAGSVPARLLGGRWLGFRSIDEHLYFFSHRTLGAMLEAAGFEVRRVVQVGKYLALPRLIERMRFYTRIGALLLRTVDRVVPKLSFYVNPRDTMLVLAVKPGGADPA
jgi:hypothetical protein